MRKSAITCCFLLIFIVHIASIQDRTINTKKKPRIVNNPAQPLHGVFHPDIDEKILVAESDDFIISAVSGMAVNSKGVLFLSDYRQVYRISPFGGAVDKIGRPGPGPGEYNYPGIIFVNSNDELFVQGSYKIHHYDNQGKFRRHINLIFKRSYRQDSFYADAAGDLYGLKTRMVKNTLQVELKKFNSQGRPLKTFTRFNEKSSSFNRVRGGGMISSTSYHEYMEDVYSTPLQNKYLCFGQNTDYKLYISDLEGNVEKVITMDIPHPKITDSELKRFRERYGQDFHDLKFPPNRPFFNSILSDEKGRIFVARVTPVTAKNRDVSLDVFNRHGHYLYRMSLKYFPRIIKDGAFYVVDGSNPDCLKIKKLTIKNHASLKY